MLVLVMQYRLYNILLTLDCHGHSNNISVCVMPLARGTQVCLFFPRIRVYYLHQSFYTAWLNNITVTI